MTNQEKIEAFLAGDTFAVAGASSRREKYGNKVLRVYQQQGLKAYPLNPREKEIEGVEAYPNLDALPEKPHGVSIITPPAITEQIVEDMGRLGIRHVWMQPGAESPQAVARAEELGMNVIAGGPCILVKLRFRDE